MMSHLMQFILIDLLGIMFVQMKEIVEREKDGMLLTHIF